MKGSTHPGCRASRRASVKAAVGDRITVHGLHVGDATRCGEVLEVKGAGGSRPTLCAGTMATRRCSCPAPVCALTRPAARPTQNPASTARVNDCPHRGSHSAPKPRSTTAVRSDAAMLAQRWGRRPPPHPSRCSTPPEQGREDVVEREVSWRVQLQPGETLLVFGRTVRWARSPWKPPRCWAQQPRHEACARPIAAIPAPVDQSRSTGVVVGRGSPFDPPRGSPIPTPGATTASVSTRKSCAVEGCPRSRRGRSRRGSGPVPRGGSRWW